MSKDQLLGVLILLGAVAVLAVYGWLIYAGLSWWAFFIVATVAVFGVMGIIAWIGWTMATTPPPAPIEALDEKATSGATAPEDKKQ